MGKMLYNDRKLMKWEGFFMSEHSEQLAQNMKDGSYVAPRKPQMDDEGISYQLAHSYHEHRLAYVQLNELENGLFDVDIKGIVRGFDESEVHFNTLSGFVTVPLESIRHIEVPEFVKWYDK